MNRILTFLMIMLSPAMIFSQSLDYYLPDEISYNEDIPTPAEVIGHEVGEWHITHDKLVYYMRALAESSPRIILEENGVTHEDRQQLILIITSEENHGNIGKIKSQHVKLTDPDVSSGLDIDNMPAVVWQGFSIHGNEPSGSNAAMLTAYYYAAAQGEQIEELLNDLVIVFDPAFNPDGLTRFSSWANSRKSKNLVADRYNMEQNEYWPGGRTNHYWFDLNRDWLTVQQPESQNRIARFHEWKPNVLTDHHEMGTNATFFFQPGIPSRNNPNTPQNNFVITEEIGTYHADALDKIGSLYYSKESYDDFFYGKGSTFPDINGGIGILFEQASSRGHLQESIHGDLTFPFTIRNQFVTSLSTVEAAKNLRVKLLEHQRKFFQDAIQEAGNSSFDGIIFGSAIDPIKSRELAHILDQQKIEVYEINQSASINGKNYAAGKSYYVPLKQAQYKLIDIMFETVTDFQDSLFYDVSSWTLPMAFGLNYDYLDSRKATSISKGNRFRYTIPEVTFEKSSYAYVINWGNYMAPSLLFQLLDQDIICKVSTEEFSDGNTEFRRGSILVPVKRQKLDEDDLYELISNVAGKYGVEVNSLSSGSTSGIFLGSRTFESLKRPNAFILVEGDIRSYDAGEVWHLLDNRMDIDLTLMPLRVLDYADLDRYNTMILVNGRYGDVSGRAEEKIKSWVNEGGNVIAMKGANNWLKKLGLVDLNYLPGNNSFPGKRTDYQFIEEYSGAQATGGAIFTGDLDVTNPIGYGYESRNQPVFVNTNSFFTTSNNKYADPFVFDSKPLASGYISEENLLRLSGTSGIRVSRSGSGRIVSFMFNPNFRAFWYGTNSMFLNSLFFIDIIDNDAAE